jgi:hypothetical protein
MDSKLTTFIGIMGFYIVLSYLLFPFLFYFIIEKSLVSAGNGFIFGSLLSIMLWQLFGQKLIR